MTRWVLAWLLLIVQPVALAESPYQRIVSLAPNFTELVYAVGGEDRLIGVVQYSDYPEAAKSLPRIGNAMRVNLERLLIMQPDLIMVWESGTPLSVQEQLREQGFKLWVREPGHLDDVAELLIEVGELTGQKDRAVALAQDYRAGLNDLRERYRDKPVVRLFYQIAERPLMTINQDHMINEAIELCGGENVFASLAPLTPTVAIEAVYAEAPELIVYGAYAGNEQAVDWLNPAILDVSVKAVSADLLHRATPRTLQGVERLCEAIDEVRNTR